MLIKRHIEETKAVLRVLQSQSVVLADIAQAEQDEYDDKPEHWRDHTPESDAAIEDIETLGTIADNIENAVTDLEAFLQNAIAAGAE